MSCVIDSSSAYFNKWLIWQLLSCYQQRQVDIAGEKHWFDRKNTLAAYPMLQSTWAPQSRPLITPAYFCDPALCSVPAQCTPRSAHAQWIVGPPLRSRSAPCCQNDKRTVLQRSNDVTIREGITSRLLCYWECPYSPPCVMLLFMSYP